MGTLSTGYDSRLRAWAAVTLALALFGQVANLAHRVLVPHKTCSEHGELVHGSSPNAPESREPASVYLSPADKELDHHEHCVFLAERRELEHGQITSASLDSFLVSTCAPHSGDLDPSGIDLVLIAPKNSPPA